MFLKCIDVDVEDTFKILQNCFILSKKWLSKKFIVES